MKIALCGKVITNILFFSPDQVRKHFFFLKVTVVRWYKEHTYKPFFNNLKCSDSKLSDTK